MNNGMVIESKTNINVHDFYIVLNCGLDPRSGHTKDHPKNGTNCLSYLPGIKVGQLSKWLCEWNCQWGHAL